MNNDKEVKEEQNQEFEATPKKKAPLNERLDNLSSKINQVYKAVRANDLRYPVKEEQKVLTAEQIFKEHFPLGWDGEESILDAMKEYAQSRVDFMEALKNIAIKDFVEQTRKLQSRVDAIDKKWADSDAGLQFRISELEIVNESLTEKLDAMQREKDAVIEQLLKDEKATQDEMEGLVFIHNEQCKELEEQLKSLTQKLEEKEKTCSEFGQLYCKYFDAFNLANNKLSNIQKGIEKEIKKHPTDIYEYRDTFEGGLNKALEIIKQHEA